MDNQDKLLEDIEMIVGKIKELYDLAYVQYSHLVDVVLEGALTDEKQMGLSQVLCRHIYYQYPQLVGNFVHMYRAMFEEKEDDNGTGDS